MEMIKMFSGLKASAVALTLGAALAVSTGAQAAKVRVAFGDIASVESLHLLAAFERAREQGVDIEVTYLQIRGHRRAGRGGRAGRYRRRRTLRARAEGQGADPHVPSAFDLKLLSGGQRAILQDLEGSERAGDRGSFARLGHRGDHEVDGGPPGHQVLQDQLHPGLRGADRRSVAGQRESDHRRFRRSPIVPRRKRPASSSSCRSTASTPPTRRCSPTRHSSRRMRPTSTRSSRRILTTWREVTANPAVVTELRAKYKLLPDLPGRSGDRDRSVFRGACERQGVPAQWRRCRGGEGRLRVLHALRSAHRRAGEPEG